MARKKVVVMRPEDRLVVYNKLRDSRYQDALSLDPKAVKKYEARALKERSGDVA
jgi:hypothetical protein